MADADTPEPSRAELIADLKQELNQVNHQLFPRRAAALGKAIAGLERLEELDHE